MEKVLITIKNIVSYSIQENEKISLLNQLRESFVIAGESAHSQQIKSLVMRLGATQSAYLLKGEEGVGKGLVARNIHYVSRRAGLPFVTVNGRSLPQGLHSVELWGSESNIGFFQAAQGGTLFIKNIEYLDEAAQAKLADLLRDKDSSRDYNVRLAAATTADLLSLVRSGKFREDLYGRVSTLSIEIKPLRERKDDLPTLVDHFSQEYCRKAGLKIRPFQSDALKLLETHDWPGNILELKNFVERIHILSFSDQFDVYDVNYAGISPSGGGLDFNGYGNFREARAQFEKDYLLAKIAENDGNISKTSEAIGLERSYLHRKIKAYGIEVDSKR